MAIALVLAACSSDVGEADGSTTSEVTPSSSPLETTTTADPGLSTLPTTTVGRVEVSVVEDVPYREPDDGRPSTVDVYIPDSSPGRAAVVLLHGWGFPGAMGPDLEVDSLAEEIARLGATVFSFGWHTGGGLSADSAADLSCIGGFVSLRAAEHGADPDDVVVVGHSMGGEAGTALALSAFALAPGADCVETGPPPIAHAVLGIAGSYGVHSRPLDDGLTMFAVRRGPADRIKEIAADEEVARGLTALQAYGLSGYGALPSSNPLRVVLLVGSEDENRVTDELVTAAFAEALRAHQIDVEVVVVPGANHSSVIDPESEDGLATLLAVRELLERAP